MKQLVFITFFTFIFLSCFAFAKETSIEATALTVKLINPKFQNAEECTIKIQISKYPFCGEEFFKSKQLIYEQKYQPGSSSSNVFNISAPSKVFYMYISASGLTNNSPLFGWIDNIYILKAGSKLTIELSPNNVHFLGKGSEIPNIQSKIVKHGYVLTSSDLHLANKKQYLLYLRKFDKSLDSSLLLQLNVIKENKKYLGDYYTKLLTANCYGYRYFSQLRSYAFIQDSIFLDDIRKYYSDKRHMLKKANFSNEVLEGSPMYANYLLQELILRERMQHLKYSGALSDPSINNIIEKIRDNYSGILRDKLLTLFMIRTDKNRNASTYFDTTIRIVQNQKYKDFLTKKRQTYGVGVPFRDFVLSDTTGKIFTIKDFQDKVVLVDFWFTGCVNCIILNKAMKPVHDYFASNDRIKFVSISIDRDKDQWIRSIKDGSYTHKGGLNLYTNGVGSKHDLINHYNIVSYPTIFIIKNGLMFSALPPQPTLFIEPGYEISKHATELIELIEVALKESN